MDLLDRQAVVDVVLRWALALDRKDWVMARGCFHERVAFDYGGLRGTREELDADAFVALRREALAHLKTHHLSAGHLVEIEGDEARCTSSFLIHRLDPARPEPNTFDSLGHYEHRLRRFAEGWKIVAATQDIAWNRGNPAIHAGAKTGDES